MGVFTNDRPIAGAGGGKDGKTPHIGSNGNWFIGTADTGVKAGGGVPPGGLITSADDPRTKPAGRYYVNEKFIGAPTLSGNDYVGLIDVIKNYDGSNNGDLIKYFTKEGMHYLIRYAGGWEVQWNTPFDGTTSYALTADKINQAIDHGTASGPGSVKGLAEGWWVIPATDPTLTGRPSGAIGDLIYHTHRIATGVGKQSYAMGMALGKNKDNQDAMWVTYRNKAGWTSWWEVKNLSGAGSTTLRQDIESLKQGQTAALARISTLETDLGNIFAPTRSTFDLEANRLIDAKLAPVIAGEISAPDVENYLKAKGWGPLSRPPIPKPPQQAVTMYAAFETNFPTSLSGMTSSTTNVFNLARSQATPARIFVAVPEDHQEADAVTGIRVDDGLKAVWESRDRTYDGKKYRVFYSPGGYHDTNAKVEIVFGG